MKFHLEIVKNFNINILKINVMLFSYGNNYIGRSPLLLTFSYFTVYSRVSYEYKILL
jgi:hypothetical protein